MAKEKKIDIVTENGDFIRSYNKKDHGAKFADLAKGFAKKNEYKILEKDL